MDKFGIPKKINRHVLKALYYISDRGFENPDFSAICERVEITMKRTVPVEDLPGMIRKSLQNMAQLGVIKVNGSKFFVRKANFFQSTPERQSSNIFRMNLDWQDEDRSKLNTKLKRRHASPEKSRKRTPLSRQLNRKVPRVLLPKINMSKGIYLSADTSRNVSPSGEICSEEENEQRSECLQVPECNITEPQAQDEPLVDPSACLELCNMKVSAHKPPITLEKMTDHEGAVVTEQKVDEEPKKDANSLNDNESPSSTIDNIRN